MSSSASESPQKQLLVLGGTGFLGSQVCQQAVDKGFAVTSLSRSQKRGEAVSGVDYRQGDARQAETVSELLQEMPHIAGIVHCIGLLFDSDSGLGDWNKFVSGSGSVPDEQSTYETITRQTAFHAVDAAASVGKNLPFVFTSAAEAGWPQMTGGSLIENTLAPDFLRRYLTAKRAVETKVLNEPAVRPVIVRPSLIYRADRYSSLPAVGAFFVGNGIGLPFVDQPVTVDDLAACMVKALQDDSVEGILRYPEINRLAKE